MPLVKSSITCDELLEICADKIFLSYKFDVYFRYVMNLNYLTL